MPDDTLVTPAPRKRRSWLRAIAWILGILIVLLVAAYLTATSSAFFKSVILPRVGKAINAQVTVSDASISPFSQVILHNLKLQPAGAEPLLTAAEVRLRYSLMDIIKGNIHVDEAALVSPVITLVEDPQGHSNLEPLLKGPPQTVSAKRPGAPAKPSAGKTLQIDVKKVALTDATISQVKNHANGTRDVAELSHLNVTLDDLKNGQATTLALGADISLQQTNATLRAKLTGNFTLALAADLKPASIKGSAHLDVTQAGGMLADAAGFGSDLSVDITPTDLKEAALRFQKGNLSLGVLRVSGPFDMQKLEGRLSIALAGVDKQLLNLVGAKYGMDFGDTTIGSTNEVELAKGGSIITVNGQLDLNRFQLTRSNPTTPQLDLRKNYDLTLDRGQSLLTLRNLMLTGTQNGKTLLKAELASPMQIPLANTNIALGDSTLSLAITGLNLADWKPFVGDVAPQGILNLTAKIWSQQGDKQIALLLDSRIDHLTVNAGSNHLADATITLHADAKAANLAQFNFTDYKLEVAHQDEKLITASGSGTYDKLSEDTDMQVAVQAALPPLLRVVPQPNMTISSGTAELKAHVIQKQKTRALTGNLALSNFSGAFGTNELRSFGTTADFDIGLASQQVQIRKLAGKLTQGSNAAGSFDLSGTYDPSTTNTDLQVSAQLALAALAQAAPRPDVRVSSGTLALKTHVMQKQKTQAATGSVALMDFTGRFGTNEVRSLGISADFDVGMTAQQAQIRKLTGKLIQGGNAGGSFDVSGAYDLVKTNASLNAKLVDFNQNGLAPFLQPALGDKKLVSIAINVNATAQYDPQGPSSVNADLQMTNLVVKDPAGQFPGKPLEAKLHADASINKQVADVRQFVITLTPTARATNQVQLSGQVDMTQTGATQGNLKLVADSLDFTTYYDLFTGAKPAPATQAGTTPTPASTPRPSPVRANQESEAIHLPLHNFTVQAAIRRLYLREVEIDDWQTKVKIDGGRVVVDPFKLTLNGSPVSSTMDLDLGVPGYKYDVALNALAIPLAPLVNSFQPERKGVLSGTLTARAKIAGAGTTGAGLQKSLTGQFDMTSTNLNLSVDNIQGKTFYTRLLKTLVKTIGAIPDLARNPTGAASSLLQGLAGLGGSSGTAGAAGALTNSPINSIVLHTTAGSGRVNLQQATVQSPTFEAQASGTITLADVLTNSPLQIPVSVSLERSVAQRINMAGNTPTNATYAKLPDFLTMKGTLGNSKPEINPIALASAVLQGRGGSAGQAGGALQSFGSLLSGSTNTNNPGTNQSGGKAGGLLQGIGSLLGNTPTNAPVTNRSPADNLLDGLFGPRKK